MTLLTVEEFREHASTGLGDDAVQRLLDAAEELIVEIGGSLADATEIFRGGGHYLILRRPVVSITKVTELYGSGSARELETNDYRLEPDRISIRRLRAGDTPSARWVGLVQVESVPSDDTALRKIVQLGLAQGFLDTHPGVTSETIGDWSETYGDTTEWSARRDALLGQLQRPDSGVGFV
jgi:hypothetical protein